MIASNNSLPGLYVHFPFCLTKCAYCDFYSITGPDLIPAYLSALDKEARIYGGTGVSPVPAQAKACGYQDVPFRLFNSLYLGGGTPSLLEAPPLAALLASLRRNFDFAPDTEITLEANPDDLHPEKLRAYRDLGINRLSLGVQSLDDAELAFLGRRHSAGQAVDAIAWARAAGFLNLSLDLMYGLPGQTPEDWARSLKAALALAPEHLSCYQLTLAEGTPLARLAAAGEITLPDEEAQRALFLFTSQFLEEQGYLHYEISNFARLRQPGSKPDSQGIDGKDSFSRKPETENRKPYYSRHNRKYWQHAPYLGLGPGAHSFKDGRRWWNLASVTDYCAALGQGKPPVAGDETLTPEQRRLETLYLGFRTREGVSLGVLEAHPGWQAALAELTKEGLVHVDQGQARPTREGLLVADRLPLLFVD